MGDNCRDVRTVLPPPVTGGVPVACITRSPAPRLNTVAKNINGHYLTLNGDETQVLTVGASGSSSGSRCASITSGSSIIDGDGRRPPGRLRGSPRSALMRSFLQPLMFRQCCELTGQYPLLPRKYLHAAGNSSYPRRKTWIRVRCAQASTWRGISPPPSPLFRSPSTTVSVTQSGPCNRREY